MSRVENFVGFPIGMGVLLDAVLHGGEFLMILGTELFTPLTITATWIAPEFDGLDEELITLLAVAAAALYVLNLLSRRYRAYTTQEDD